MNAYVTIRICKRLCQLLKLNVKDVCEFYIVYKMLNYKYRKCPTNFVLFNIEPHTPCFFHPHLSLALHFLTSKLHYVPCFVTYAHFRVVFNISCYAFLLYIQHSIVLFHISLCVSHSIYHNYDNEQNNKTIRWKMEWIYMAYILPSKQLMVAKMQRGLIYTNFRMIHDYMAKHSSQ
jgi:hypothetical protein